MELGIGTTPDEIRENLAGQDDSPVPLNEYDKMPDDELFSFFGVSGSTGNKIGFTDLYKKMKSVGLSSYRMKDVQDEWFRGFDAYTNVVEDPSEKEKRLALRQQLENRRIRIKEDTIGNIISETIDKNKNAGVGQVERVVDAVAHRITMSDEEILAEYDPELLAKAKSLGGVQHLFNIGMGVINAQDDLTGVMGTFTLGATDEQRKLGVELYNKLSTYRSEETLNRANQEGGEVEFDDGTKQKMTRMQAQQIIDQQGSSVVGQNELAKAFEENAISVFTQDGILAGIQHLVFNQGLGSTIRQLPTTVAGGAMMFLSLPVGLAIMNSGNMVDQEWSAVSDLIGDEIKKAKLDITKMSANDYLAFAKKLATEGKISQASFDGISTGAIMTMAGTLTGGAVNGLSKKLLASGDTGGIVKSLSTKFLAGGLKVSDECLQEVAETTVENYRNGEDLTKGLSQACVAATLTTENTIQNVANVISKDKPPVEQPTEQSVEQPTEQSVEQPTEQSVEQPTEQPVEQPTEQPVEQTTDPLDVTRAKILSLYDELNNTDTSEERKVAIQEELNRIDRENEDAVDSNGNGIVAQTILNNSQEKPTTQVEQPPTQVEQPTTKAESPYKDFDFSTYQPNRFVDPNSAERRLSPDDIVTLSDDQIRQVVHKMGGLVLTDEAVNFKAEYDKRGLNKDESGSNNRNGSQNADGQTIEQGTNELNASGAERSNETSQSVSPTQTETTTTGYSQSNTPSTPNTAEQSDNNSQASSATGADGRTGATDGQSVDQGKLGEQRGEQDREPTQTPRTDSTDTGVHQRSESDSERETLEQDSVAKSSEQPKQKANKREKLSVETLGQRLKSDDDIKNVTVQDVKDLGGTSKLNGLLWVIDTALKNNIPYDVAVEHTKQLAKSLGLSDKALPQALSRAVNLNSSYIFKHLQNYKLTQLSDKGKDQPKQTTNDRQDANKQAEKDLETPQHQEAVFMAKTAEQFKSVEELSNETKRLMEQDLDNTDRNTRLWQKHNELVAQRKGRKGWGKKDQKAHTGIADGAKINLSTVIGDAERTYQDNLAENVVEETKQPEVKGKYEQQIEKQNKLNRTIDSVGENANQEGQLGANLKKRYPDVDVDKLLSVQGQINDYSAESHTQYQERVAKGHNPDLVVKELAEVQFAIANSRSVIKSHPNDRKPPVPEQWHSVIRNGKKKTSRWVKDGTLPFTQEQKDRIEKALDSFDWSLDPEQTYEQIAESGDTQDQITTLLADMQSGQFELTTPNITEQAIESALLEFSPEQQAEIREQAREFAVNDDGYPLQQDEEISNVQLAGIAIYNRQGAKGLLKQFFDRLYSILASVVALVTVGAMTVPTDAYAQQQFATYTQGERIQGVSQDVSNTANWVVANKDHNGKSFVVADKDNGKVHIFSTDGKLLNTQNALFGMNKGNDNGFGNTPSGRFSLGKIDTKTLGKKDQEVFGDSVLAFKDVNTKATKLAKDGRIIAMHRVVNTPQRKQSLTSATANDNFLTHGCVNIPTAFYNSAVDSLDGAMFYVLDNTDGEVKQSKPVSKTSKPSFTNSGKPNFSPKRPKFSTSHRGEHLAPVNDGFNARLDDLTTLYPEDIYSDKAWHYYGHGDKTQDQAVARKLQSFRGKPEMEVTVYRAVPKSAKANKLVTGDWVTTERHYAETHGEHTLNGEYKIIEQTVKVKDLFTNADSLYELGVDFGDIKHNYSIAPLENFDRSKTDLTKTKVEKALEQSLGGLARNVVVVSSEDFAHSQVFQSFIKNGIEGAYDPETQTVYIVADNIQAQDGLTAEQRLAWVAWHELTHQGLDTQYGEDLQNILDTARFNPFIEELAMRIADERQERGLMSVDQLQLATEEALAELNAARKTGDYRSLESRYGVEVPRSMRNNPNMFKSLYDRIKRIVGNVLGLKLKVSDNAIVGLLSNLQYDQGYTNMGARELTTKLLEQANSPVGTESIRYSLSGVVGLAIKKGYTAVRKIRSDSISNSTGKNPNHVTPGQSATDKNADLADPMEDTIVALIDSEYRVTKAMGGVTSDANLEMKKAKNKMAQKQTEFNKEITSWADRTIAIAHDLKAKTKGAVYKGRKNLVSVFEDVQNLAVARYALTSGNREVREQLVKQIDGYDIFDNQGNFLTHVDGLKDQVTQLQQGIQQLGLAATQWQTSQLAKLQKELLETEERLKKHDDLLNRIVSSTEQNGQLVVHPDAQGLPIITDNIVDSQGNTVSVNRSVSREGMAFLGGMTNAEAYAMITNYVNKGLISVKVKGKDWNDYIADVGFTLDNGFADKSQDYTIDPMDIEFIDGLAPAIDGAVNLQHKHHNYLAANNQQAFAPHNSSNPHAVATSGKVDIIRSNPQVQPDGSVVYTVQNARTIEQQISLKEAAQWQHQRAGRSFSSANMMQQLQYTSSSAVRQVGMQEFGKELDKLHKQNPKLVRKILSSSQFFTDVDGVIKTEVQNGKLVTYKLSFRDNNLNDDLFGKNRKQIGDVWDVVDGSLKFLGFWSRWKSVMLTATPIWAIQNAYKGFAEKMRWLMGVLDNSSAFAQQHPQLFAQLETMKGLGFKFATNLKWRGYLNLAKSIGGLKGAVQFARYVNNPTKSVNAFLPSGGMGQATFLRLLALYEQGAITHRADLVKAQNRDLLSTIPRTKLGSKINSRKGADLASKLLTFTSATEFLSTLAFVDTLKEMGFEEKQAVGFNLVAMNFNDSGASYLSSFIRTTTPFANATAQGSRATAQSFSSKQGWLAFSRGLAIKAAVFYPLLSMLAEKMDCEEYDGRHPWDNINSFEMAREMPLFLRCNLVRFPVQFGSGMIEWAGAVAIGQWWSGKWSAQQAMIHFLDSLRENLIPVPTGTLKGDIMGMIADTLLPDLIAKYVRVNRGYTDFYNKLLPFGVDPNEDYLYKKNKATTDPLAKDFAGFMGKSLGLDWNGEQWLEFSKSVVDGPLREIFAEGVKTARGEQEMLEFFGNSALSALGWKSIKRKDLDKQQIALRRIHNALEKYGKVYDIYVEATTTKIDTDGDGEEDTQITLGYSTKSKTSRAKISQRYEWLAEQEKKLSPKEYQVLEAMVEYGIENRRAMQEKDRETKNLMYMENNLNFMHTLDKIEGKK